MHSIIIFSLLCFIGCSTHINRFEDKCNFALRMVADGEESSDLSPYAMNCYEKGNLEEKKGNKKESNYWYQKGCELKNEKSCSKLK